MAAIQTLNPKAEVARRGEALNINISAAKGLHEVLKTNLGPKGTMKMLVSGAGDIKITKDGNVLLHEMQIQHPTASLIARAATAQDDITGDGTTSTVLLIGELLKQADLYISEGLHPRVVTEGFEIGKNKALEVLDKIRIKADLSREQLLQVAQTALRTKLQPQTADSLAEICVDAMNAIRVGGDDIDLHMVEIMEMQHRAETETQLVRGIVMDHGARHPDMKKRVNNAYILTCNVGLEYEKTEVNSGFFYKSATEREKMVEAERDFITKRCEKIIELKNKVCGDDKDKNFVVLNQKGIDPLSLDLLAKAGIVALRRAKRRNMERLTLACGGTALNSVEDMTPDCLGFCEEFYEYTLGESKYSFVEGCKDPKSVTILIKAANKHTITQIKDAVRDGLRAIKNTLDDGYLVPGGGAFEVAAAAALGNLVDVQGKVRLGVKAFADSILVIPKVLAQNGGFDQQEVLVRLQDEYTASGRPVGLDLTSGEAMFPEDQGVLDNYNVKKMVLNSCTVIASNLLLVDEMMRAGLSSLKKGGA